MPCWLFLAGMIEPRVLGGGFGGCLVGGVALAVLGWAVSINQSMLHL
jgi:hypothetical protein